ncbi:MAG: transporter [Myxococcales bacterium]
MRGLAGVVCLATWLSLWTASGHAQLRSDPRDYDGSRYPTRSTFFSNYLRHESSSYRESATISYAVFGATYVLKVGNLGIAPFNFFLPVVDVTAYVPSGMPNLNYASHSSGIGDLLYIPAVGYTFRHSKESYTYTAFSLYMNAPTGSYKASKLVNIGENRWVFRPQGMVGHRYKIVSLEGVTGVACYTDNPDYVVPMLGKQRLEQKPSYGADFHLAVDLSERMFVAVSYYVTSYGRRFVNVKTDGTSMQQTIDPRQHVNAMRFTWAISVLPELLLLLQYNQDLTTSGGAAAYRFYGARISYALLSPWAKHH